MKAPIIGTSERYAWKRELSCFQGQDLPEALFGGSSLEIFHQASGLRLSFSALEALRSWASMDTPPVKVRHAWSPTGPQARAARALEFDYTFTTSYRGSLAAVPELGSGLPCSPDTSSLLRHAAVDLAKGTARLRKPLCKCRGVGGRVPFCGEGSRSDGSRSQDSNALRSSSSGESVVKELHSSTLRPLRPSRPLRPPPAWIPIVGGSMDAEGALREAGVPLFVDRVTLYEDALHENGIAFLRASVFVGEKFWFAYLRYFLRVDGVMSRVFDTRYMCRLDTPSCFIHREQSWREGTWDQLIGKDRPRPTVGGALPKLVSLEEANDRVASKRLPHCRTAEHHSVTLPPPPPPPPPQAPSSHLLGSKEGNQFSILWTRNDLRCDVPCSGSDGSVAVAVASGGTRIEAFAPLTGKTIWRRELPSMTDPALVSAAISPLHSTLALGDECSKVHLWDANTGSSMASFVVRAEESSSSQDEKVLLGAKNRNRKSANRWVEG